MTTYTAEARRRAKDKAYRKDRILRQLRGEETSLVDATSAQSHVRALVALGWSCTAIQQTAGETISDTTVVNLLNGRHDNLERNTAAAILAVPRTYAVGPLVADTAKVPLGGAQRRIQSLLRLGQTHAVLRKRTGVDTSHVARGTYQQILARKWRAVDQVFADLCLTVGPSEINRERSVSLGYVSPLAWDDIDDPREKPQGFRARTATGHSRRTLDHALVERVLAGEWSRAHNCTVAEREEICRRWAGRDGTMLDLERLTGWKPERYFKFDAA